MSLSPCPYFRHTWQDRKHSERGHEGFLSGEARWKTGPEWEVCFGWCMNVCGMRGSVCRGLQERATFCTEELITAALSPSEEIISAHPHSNNDFPRFNSIFLSPRCFSHHMKAKIGPAAFPRPFCPCSGRRLAHRGSCYSFHFLNIFLFFFLSSVEPRRVYENFIRLCRMAVKSEGSKMAAQIQAAVTPARADK